MFTNLTIHYGWWLLALVLVGAELMVPGFFMLWIGIAAAAVGLILLFAPPLSFEVQAILFAALAVVSCFVYWKFIRRAIDEPSDLPLLNRRGEQLIGRRFVLETAIANGQGRPVSVTRCGWLKGRSCRPARRSKSSRSMARPCR
jgi:membrane protein implicated in regulation of membrane protease activity